MFNRDEYLSIKARLDFSRSYVVTLAVLAFDVLLVAAGILLLRQGQLLSFLLSQVLFAVLFFHNFGILHEAGHGNCSSSRAVNTITGHYASIFCFMPFFPWKDIHQKHHVWAGNSSKDPTARNLQRWRAQGHLPWLLRASWRSWIPLSALAQHFVFWSYPLVLIREDRSKLAQCAVSVLLLPVSYVAFYLLWPDVFNPLNFALAFVIYLFAEELVNAPHHLDLFHYQERLPLWEQWRAARTCYYPRLVSEFFVLNFNFHVEHHLYPALPWYRLRRARKLVRAAVGEQYVEATGISWNLANRSRDIQKMLLGGQ